MTLDTFVRVTTLLFALCPSVCLGDVLISSLVITPKAVTKSPAQPSAKSLPLSPSSEKLDLTIPPDAPPSNQPPTPKEPTITGSNSSEIIASALGATRDQALASAQLTAVEQALGRLIDAETIIENDTVIRDSVLSATNGFIERFTVLSETKEGDLFRVRIRAPVRSGKLAERLKTLTKTTVTVDGSKLQGEVRTKAKSRDDQIKMLQGSLETILEDVVKVRVIGEPEVVMGVEAPQGSTRLRIQIEIAVDQVAWDARMKRLTPLLDEFALAKQSAPMRLHRKSPPNNGSEVLDRTFLYSSQSEDIDSQLVFPPPSWAVPQEWAARAHRDVFAECLQDLTTYKNALGKAEGDAKEELVTHRDSSGETAPAREQ